MDLTEYRASELERTRIADLMDLVPGPMESVLDAGARDGFISKLLTQHFSSVTALDLDLPQIDDRRVKCVKGDVTRLQFPDASFDLVLCAEVIEHIPPSLLAQVCDELSRVASKFVLIGVPYKQDLRVGRTTCYTCGKKNPPWGHVNSFDEDRLIKLFPNCEPLKTSYVGRADAGTNAASSLLMNWAGNPFGTYSQEEPCVHCGSKLKAPPTRTLRQKILTRTAHYAKEAQALFSQRHANWVHILFEKRPL